MEARALRAAALAALLLVCMGAQYPGPNFVVETPDPALAKRISQAAEEYRHDLAIAWLGHALPNWSAPCRMTVEVGPHLGAGGATTFMFDRGEVFGWRMNIQGSVERIFDSVLPHEITHMIFASHFRQPLPRWADEGGATSVEHPSERQKHREMLIRFLRSDRGIAFSRMFAMREYPPDVMPLYAQGYSVAEYLIGLGGRRKYVAFVGEGLRTGDWPAAVRKHYGLDDLGKLQNTWLAWVKQGSPPLNSPAQPAAAPGPAVIAASTSGTRPARPEPNLVLPVERQARPEQTAAAWTPADSTYLRAGNRAAPAVRPPPPSNAGQLAAAPRSEPIVLPADGWRAAVTAPPAPPGALAGPRTDSATSARPQVALPAGPPAAAAGAVSTEVTRPQPIERPQQKILEWVRTPTCTGGQCTLR